MTLVNGEFPSSAPKRPFIHSFFLSFFRRTTSGSSSTRSGLFGSPEKPVAWLCECTEHSLPRLRGNARGGRFRLARLG